MKELVLSHAEIESISKKVGKQITNDLKNEEKAPVFVVVMKGALNFFESLMNNLEMDVLTDYVQVSSYQGLGQTGKLEIKHMISGDIADRTVVLVEDVVDSGYTIKALKEYITSNFKPKRILVAALFDKPNSHKVEIKVDYIGKSIENKFLIGFGLDYYEFERNVPYVYVPDQNDLDRLNRLVAKDSKKD